MTEKSCTAAKSEIEGVTLALSILGIFALSALYYTSEQRYPGTGIQSVIYGGALLGGISLISYIPASAYGGYYCGLEYSKKSSR